MKSFRVVGVSCAIVLLAACGGGSDSAESTETGDTMGQTEANIEATGNDCVDAAAAFNAVVQGVMSGLMDPTLFDDELNKANIEEARAAVPDEIADDFELFSQAYIMIGEVLAEVGANGGFTNPENVAKFEELSKELENPELEAAAQRVGEYFQSECTGG
jgi:hypothetical protein